MNNQKCLNRSLKPFGAKSLFKILSLFLSPPTFLNNILKLFVHYKCPDCSTPWASVEFLSHMWSFLICKIKAFLALTDKTVVCRLLKLFQLSRKSLCRQFNPITDLCPPSTRRCRLRGAKVRRSRNINTDAPMERYNTSENWRQWFVFLHKH